MRTGIIECYEPPVYSFAKYSEAKTFVFIGNFSEDRQFVATHPFHEAGICGKKTDLPRGKTINFDRGRVLVGPFEYLWLV